jgi:hypothetical protein
MLHLHPFLINRRLIVLAGNCGLDVGLPAQCFDDAGDVAGSDDFELLFEDCPHEGVDLVLDHVFGAHSTHLARNQRPLGAKLRNQLTEAQFFLNGPGVLVYFRA